MAIIFKGTTGTTKIRRTAPINIILVFLSNWRKKFKKNEVLKY